MHTPALCWLRSGTALRARPYTPAVVTHGCHTRSLVAGNFLSAIFTAFASGTLTLPAGRALWVTCIDEMHATSMLRVRAGPFVLLDSRCRRRAYFHVVGGSSGFVWNRIRQTTRAKILERRMHG